MASGVRSVTVVAQGVAVQASTLPSGKGSLTLFGVDVRESNGTPAVATVRIRENTASGQILSNIELAADKSDWRWWGPQGLRCDGDIFVEVVTGVVEVVIHWG